jgi:hypothetical protein
MKEIEVTKANEEALALMTARALEAESALKEITQTLLNDRPLPECYAVEPQAIVWQVRELKRQLEEATRKLREAPAIAVQRAAEFGSPGGTD